MEWQPLLILVKENGVSIPVKVMWLFSAIFFDKLAKSEKNDFVFFVLKGVGKWFPVEDDLKGDKDLKKFVDDVKEKLKSGEGISERLKEVSSKKSLSIGESLLFVGLFKIGVGVIWFSLSPKIEKIVFTFIGSEKEFGEFEEFSRISEIGELLKKKLVPE